MDRAAAEAVKMEAERIVSPNRRLGTAPNVPPRGPVQGPAQGGAQALQPGLLQQLPRDNGRYADGGVGRLNANSYSDANTKEGKYEIFTDLSEDLKNLAQYNLTKSYGIR